MKINFARSLFAVTFFSLVLVFQNCSNAKFTTAVDPNASNAVSGNDGTNGGDDSTCRPNTVDASKIVKVLFVVDNSGSNVGEGGTATDPNKTWRSASLKTFFDAYSGRSNFHYGLITFQRSSATPQITVNGSAGFTNNMALVESGVDKFKNTADGGTTPYKAALSMAKSIIDSDLQDHAADKASYVMVMISDGKATDYREPDQVIPDASAIKSLAPAQVSLNSIYYYASAFVEDDTKYLRNISTVGGGAFVTANSNQTLKIEDVIRVPGSGCQ